MDNIDDSDKADALPYKSITYFINRTKAKGTPDSIQSPVNICYAFKFTAD